MAETTVRVTLTPDERRRLYDPVANALAALRAAREPRREFRVWAPYLRELEARGKRDA